jgi:hypothetical protein
MVVLPVYLTAQGWANMTVETVYDASDGVLMAGINREGLGR